MKRFFYFKNIENISYEVQYFHDTFVCEYKNEVLAWPTKKIGMKKTDSIIKNNHHYNEYYNGKIYDFLIKSLIDLEINGYKIGFLTEKKMIFS